MYYTDCTVCIYGTDCTVCMPGIAYVAERKYFTCRSRESNPGFWIYRQTLYHVAVKAGFYRKAVEVYYIPRPCDIHPLQCEIRPRISWYRNHVKMNPREIFMHRTVIGWVIYVGRHCRRAKIFYLPQPGIEPRLLDLQANTLLRRCKSWLPPQGSRSALYT